MNLLLCFLTAAGLSALGALPVGLINLSLANWTIKRGRKAGLVAAGGAILVEFIYTFVAVYFIDILVTNETLDLYIKVFSIFVFIGLGIFYLRKTLQGTQPSTNVSTSKSSGSFWYGMGIAGINLLIIPYWIFLTIWLKSNGYHIESLTEILWITMGSALGAGAVFLIYVWLGTYIVRKVAKVNIYTNRVLTILFFLLALVQIIRIITTA